MVQTFCIIPVFSAFAASDVGEADDGARSSITVPMTFNGAKPDASEVQVHNAAPNYTVESTDSLLTQVTTNMINPSGTTTLITASKYYFKSNYIASNASWFIAKFPGIYSSGIDGLPDEAVVGTVEYNFSTSANALHLNIQGMGSDAYISGDISSLLSGTSGRLYITLLSYNGNVLCQTTSPVDVSFVSAEARMVTGKYLYFPISDVSTGDWFFGAVKYVNRIFNELAPPNLLPTQ